MTTQVETANQVLETQDAQNHRLRDSSTIAPARILMTLNNPAHPQLPHIPAPIPISETVAASPARVSGGRKTVSPSSLSHVSAVKDEPRASLPPQEPPTTAPSTSPHKRLSDQEEEGGARKKRRINSRTSDPSAPIAAPSLPTAAFAPRPIPSAGPPPISPIMMGFDHSLLQNEQYSSQYQKSLDLKAQQQALIETRRQKSREDVPTVSKPPGGASAGGGKRKHRPQHLTIQGSHAAHPSMSNYPQSAPPTRLTHDISSIPRPPLAGPITNNPAQPLQTGIFNPYPPNTPSLMLHGGAISKTVLGAPNPSSSTNTNSNINATGASATNRTGSAGRMVVPSVQLTPPKVPGVLVPHPHAAAPQPLQFPVTYPTAMSGIQMPGAAGMAGMQMNPQSQPHLAASPSKQRWMNVMSTVWEVFEAEKKEWMEGVEKRVEELQSGFTKDVQHLDTRVMKLEESVSRLASAIEAQNAASAQKSR
ncbi:hypothetical protein BT69DRAFT_1283671 [Atractiella rhizophila]|nr:hypothetical protein BT69DRAFT_1283671 [Atractiella rhizophila]